MDIKTTFWNKETREEWVEEYTRLATILGILAIINSVHVLFTNGSIVLFIVNVLFIAFVGLILYSKSKHAREERGKQ